MRLRLRRREGVPAEVLALLDRDERVVSWAPVGGGGADAGAVVVATPRGIWWPGDGYRLIGWQFVDKATWREGVLSIVQADVIDDLLLVDRPTVHARLATPRDLPPIVRRRVEANVVHSELVQVSGGTALLVGRRVPGQDGLVWWARLSTGTHDLPEVRAAISAPLARLRADAGRRAE